jgi:4a-hydroxytetrahydrobiopterin dehydratase
MAKLSEEQIGKKLGELSGWERNSDAIRRTFKFADFADALVFVNRVGELAETADHHPDIDIRYNKVTLELSTHSAGGLTAKDFDLAAQLTALVD